MAIANKFIHFNTKAGFLNKINEYVTYNESTNKYTPLAGKTDDWNMFKNYTCFIKDSQEIWTHEQFYGSSEAPFYIVSIDKIVNHTITSDEATTLLNEIQTALNANTLVILRNGTKFYYPDDIKLNHNGMPLSIYFSSIENEVAVESTATYAYAIVFPSSGVPMYSEYKYDTMGNNGVFGSNVGGFMKPNDTIPSFGTSKIVCYADHVHPISPTNKFNENKLVQLMGDVSGYDNTDFENGLNINCTIENVNANAIKSGTISADRLPEIPLSKLPAGALERLFVCDTEALAMSKDVQEGDVVQVVANNNKMYFCISNTASTFAAKFKEFTAGTATSVPWTGITGKPEGLDNLDTKYVNAVSPLNPDTDYYGEIKNTDTSINLKYNGTDPSEVLVNDGSASLKCGTDSFVSVNVDEAKIGYGNKWNVTVDYSGSINLRAAGSHIDMNGDMEELTIACGSKQFYLSEEFNGVNFGFEVQKGVIYPIFNATALKDHNNETLTTTQFINNLGIYSNVVIDWDSFIRQIKFGHAIRMWTRLPDTVIYETVNVQLFNNIDPEQEGEWDEYSTLNKIIFTAKTWKAVVTVSGNNLTINYYDFSPVNLTTVSTSITLAPGVTTTLKESIINPAAFTVNVSLTEDVDECIFIMNGQRPIKLNSSIYCSQDIPLKGSSSNSVRIYYFKRVPLYNGVYGTVVNCTEYTKS